MAYTHNISLQLLYPHQMHKEILINENTVILDAMFGNGVQSKKLQYPKSDYQVGDKYIVPENPCDEWKGMENQLVVRLDNRWLTIQPKAGMIFWLIDEEKLLTYSQNDWKVLFDNICSNSTT